MSTRSKKILTFFAGIALCIGIYEIIAYSTGLTFLPDFFLALKGMFLLMGKGFTWVSLGYSLLRLLISFLISAFVGIMLGILAGYFETLAKILAPLITILRAIPTIAVIFLLLVYVPHFSLYVVFLLLFPLIYQASLEGASEVTRRYDYDLRMRGKWSLSNITRVVFPLSQDYILLGLIQAFGLGFKVEIMAETFGYNSSFQGLGKLLYLYYSQVEYSDLVSLVLLILSVSLLGDASLLFLRDKIEDKIGISKKRIWFK